MSTDSGADPFRSTPWRFGASDLRYERKFRPERMSFNEVRLSISLASCGFRRSYADRNVNNIYFDSSNLTACRENIEGASPRIKTRLRWYGEFSQPSIAPTLEFKRKVGHVGDKIRVNLEEWSTVDPISNARIEGMLKAAEGAENFLPFLTGVKCVLANSYKRSYFETFDRRFRITIDRGLTFSPFRFGRLNMKERILDSGLVVELKYSSELESQAEKVINELKFRVVKFSKYVQGVIYLKNSSLLDPRY